MSIIWIFFGVANSQAIMYNLEFFDVADLEAKKGLLTFLVANYPHSPLVTKKIRLTFDNILPATCGYCMKTSSDGDQIFSIAKFFRCPYFIGYL